MDTLFLNIPRGKIVREAWVDSRRGRRKEVEGTSGGWGSSRFLDGATPGNRSAVYYYVDDSRAGPEDPTTRVVIIAGMFPPFAYSLIPSRQWILFVCCFPSPVLRMQAFWSRLSE